MDRLEFEKIIKGMKSIWTKSDYIPDETAMELWYTLFKHVPYKAMSTAVQMHMHISSFPPAPADINRQLDKLRKADPLPAEDEAWQQVRKAVSNSGYHAEEEFEKLPEIVKLTVQSPSNLRSWGMMEIETFESVVKSQFLRAYRVRRDREAEERRLPEPIRKALELARNPQLEDAHGNA